MILTHINDVDEVRAGQEITSLVLAHGQHGELRSITRVGIYPRGIHQVTRSRTTSLFYIVTKGKGHVQSNDGRWPFRDGTIMMFEPGDSFRIEAPPTDFVDCMVVTYQSTLGVDMDTPIRIFLRGDANRSERCINLLRQAQIMTLQDLVQKSEEDLLAITGLGETLLGLIKQRLAEVGLKLKFDD